ncbi:cytochrome c biogenesis protein CcsA [Epilithonimonas lactis]|uniref:Cytochrome C biogenesis protein CcsB n=1 Tax=Epilithonimonas lactis TaxID=421072 RepID=A0A085B7C1_9FLAO|nr:cytochrome c biogenesis protein CcsA [Epilithonimonas lactis]KFC18366.1 cytochrome C biogenesis protein CcsB [Epilithonimonas lactis]SER03462.1 cytochrome c-type biogenesis protein CcsB [Epilithonimonas lactis]
MKKIQDILISTRTMALLLLVFAISMAVATFIENDYGTPTAKALIYEAKWFEAVMFLLILNFIGNIGRYRLFRREKWPILVFHLAFILIFIGGAITRYISFEGTMHIREGETNNEIITDKHFFKIKIEEKGEQQNYHDVPYLMSPLHHDFQATYDFLGKEKIVVKAVDYIQRKKDSLVAGAGKEYLHLVSTSDMGGRQNIYLGEGDVQNINGTLVSYNRTAIEGAVEFQKKDGQLYIKTPTDAAFMTMATQATGTTKKDEFQPLVLRSLYTIDQLKLVIPEGTKKGKLVNYEGDKQKDKDVPDLLRVEVSGPKTKQMVDLVVEKGNPNNYKQIKVDGLDIMLGFGPKVYFTQPFALKLEKFVMETYPGSSSPSAYESHVKIVDEGKETPYNIYMNHVLNYKGYRFFQASFDPDRKGTVLSVNHDFWGTLISYIGYAFLFIGMFVTMFWKGSRFWSLNQMLKTISKKKAKVAVMLLLSFGLNAQEIDMHGKDGSHEGHSNSTEAKATAPNKNPMVLDADEMVKNITINKEHADKFGSLLVQNYEGRIVPANTQALDILHKLTLRSTFQDLDANQWFLAATIDPMFWAQVNIIKIETAGKVGKDLRAKTKATEEGFTSLIKLFPADKNGNLRFVLEDDYNDAFRKKPAERTRYDEAVIKLNDKVQVLNGIMSYQYFRTIPVKNDSNHTWSSVMTPTFEPDENAQSVLGPYLSSVLMATQGGSWAKADAELKKVEAYQQKWGKNVVPSETKVKIEVLINKLDINFKLLIFYTMIGGLLLILGFAQLFKPSKILNNVIKALIYIGAIGYTFHFLGLVARWYISGHAPWSNGYEAIIFISWVGISAGYALYRNSNTLIPAAGFLVAVIMMGFAHGGSALDPQITPLVPVLKSYWLVVHVAIITSSYGFFSLSMLIAMISLIFYIIANKDTFKRHNDTTLKELAIVSEMSLNIGLLALTIGNFLGGIWANESWGRYWSWDPKETWAFISIMIYAFVIHMRLVPGLRGRYTFHVVTMFAFCSMVMTYFGVNYYLSGLHSYAKGDPIPLPLWVYVSIGYMIVLSIFAWIKYKKLHNDLQIKKDERTQVEP